MILERPPRPNLGTARKIEANTVSCGGASWLVTLLVAPTPGGKVCRRHLSTKTRHTTAGVAGGPASSAIPGGRRMAREVLQGRELLAAEGATGSSAAILA